jgi:hypothetical protein
MEKRYQAEVPRSLSRLGLCIKLQSDTVICPKCRRPIYPHHKGLSDYLFVAEPSGKASFIEIKGGERNISLYRISTEQHYFLSQTLQAFGSGYLWLFMTPKPRLRLAYLIPYSELLQLEADMLYLPDHYTGSKAGVSLALFQRFALERTRSLWRPPPTHPIYDGCNTSWETFLESKGRQWFYVANAD